MADDDDILDEGHQPIETPQAPSLPDEDYKAKWEASERERKKLYEENKGFKQAERERIKATYPGLDDEDLKGLNPAQIDRILAKVTGTAPKPTPTEGEGSDTPAAPAQAAADLASTRTFVERGVAAAAPAKQKIPFVEAQKKMRSGEWDWHRDIRPRIVSGEIEMPPGVEVPT